MVFFSVSLSTVFATFSGKLMTGIENHILTAFWLVDAVKLDVIAFPRIERSSSAAFTSSYMVNSVNRNVSNCCHFFV
jgi:hypothetical protein